MDAYPRVYLNIAVAVGIFLVLWYLGAMLRREWVKVELLERGCKPIHIRWVPLAYWGSAWPFFSGPAFKVCYLDSLGLRHQAYCMTSNIRRRQVIWLKDEVADPAIPDTTRENLRQKRRPVASITWINAIPFALLLYGLKCVLTQHGHLPWPSKWVMRSFVLRPVEGVPAVLAGLAYIAMGAFVYLSGGDPPDAQLSYSGGSRAAVSVGEASLQRSGSWTRRVTRHESARAAGNRGALHAVHV